MLLTKLNWFLVESSARVSQLLRTISGCVEKFNFYMKQSKILSICQDPQMLRNTGLNLRKKLFSNWAFCFNQSFTFLFVSWWSGITSINYSVNCQQKSFRLAVGEHTHTHTHTHRLLIKIILTFIKCTISFSISSESLSLSVHSPMFAKGTCKKQINAYL